MAFHDAVAAAGTRDARALASAAVRLAIAGVLARIAESVVIAPRWSQAEGQIVVGCGIVLPSPTVTRRRRRPQPVAVHVGGIDERLNRHPAALQNDGSRQVSLEPPYGEVAKARGYHLAGVGLDRRNGHRPGNHGSGRSSIVGIEKDLEVVFLVALSAKREVYIDTPPVEVGDGAHHSGEVIVDQEPRPGIASGTDGPGSTFASQSRLLAEERICRAGEQIDTFAGAVSRATALVLVALTDLVPAHGWDDAADVHRAGAPSSERETADANVVGLALYNGGLSDGAEACATGSIIVAADFVAAPRAEPGIAAVVDGDLRVVVDRVARAHRQDPAAGSHVAVPDVIFDLRLVKAAAVIQAICGQAIGGRSRGVDRRHAIEDIDAIRAIIVSEPRASAITLTEFVVGTQ